MEVVCGGGGVLQSRYLLNLLSSPSKSYLFKPPTIVVAASAAPSLRLPRLSRSLSLVTHAKKKEEISLAVLEEEEDAAAADDDGTAEEEGAEESEDEILVDFEDDFLMDGTEDFEDDFEQEEINIFVGDGGSGGGISLAGTWWDKKALSIAEEVSVSFDGDFKIYAFKASADSTIRVRIEKLSTKYGSPSIDDIIAFTNAYRSRLDEAEQEKTVPYNLTLEVSSPGVERVVRVPEELERFKERPMYVKYVTVDDSSTTSFRECDGIFRLVSYDIELRECIWGIADVKVNRQQAGKGRPLSKKQRDWRLQTPFEALRLVRLHSEC